MLPPSERFSTDTYARLLEASQRVVTGHRARICDVEDVAHDRAACVAAARTAVRALYGALRLAPRQVEVMERRLSGNPRSAIAADLDCGTSSVRDVQSRVEDRHAARAHEEASDEALTGSAATAKALGV